MDKETINALLTLVGVAITAFISWRLGKLQLKLQERTTDRTATTTSEVEFRNSLLHLIDQQEEKMQSMEEKIDRQDSEIEKGKLFQDELKRANLNLTIDNQRLRYTVAGLEETVKRLTLELDQLKGAL